MSAGGLERTADPDGYLEQVPAIIREVQRAADRGRHRTT